MNVSGFPGTLSGYDPSGYVDELITPDTAATRAVAFRFDGIGLEQLRARSDDASRELFNLGITFTVYSDSQAIDRILPFDVIPRVITRADWDRLEKGVIQRVRTLNLFLADVYGAQKALKDGVVPSDLVLTNETFVKEMVGFRPPHGVYVHINGTDLIRDQAGEFRVLEDNARTPSGVSYVVENRHLMQRLFPDIMGQIGVREVSEYGQMLYRQLASTAPETAQGSQVVLLSPGVFNSAYFEHVFLAREMGVPLVEGADLIVRDDRVWMRSVGGLEPVDVIYRRIGDDFLDPEVFREDSLLGVPGLFRAYREGNVTLANAIGTGIADDKAIYAYMPRLTRYYLDEDPILANVDTWICREPEALAYTLDHLDEMVVKPVGESGGYGITVGPRSSRAELEACRARLKENPARYIAQPMIGLSVCPTLADNKVAPRHVDLRPFAVTGAQGTWVLPGGLTRVALKEGSIVVNSSQGGGSKDTWVLV
ncbi:MAG: circularly permuted type 2 ATP-grasp protein [Geminicoccaceae bacterium]